jgi:hypothetical protein
MASPSLTVESLDRTASAAKSARGGLSALEAELSKVADNINKVERAMRQTEISKIADLRKRGLEQMKLQRDELTRNLAVEQKAAAEQKKALSELKSKAAKDDRDRQKDLKQDARESEAALNSVASAALSAGRAVASMAGSLAMAGAKFALDAARFKQDTQFAWRFALGGAQEAATTYDYASKIANELGTNLNETAGQLKELFSLGFRGREAEMMVQMLADVKAMGGKADPAAIGNAVMSLKKNEALSVEMFKPLTELGPGARAKVYDTLAKQLGIKAKDDFARERAVNAALSTSQLRGQKAMDLYSKAFLQVTGKDKAGAVGKEFADTTITGSIDKVQNKLTSLFNALKTGSAGKMLVDTLQKVAAAIDPSTESGKRLLSTIEKIVDTGSKLAKEIDVDKLIDGFTRVSDVVGGLMPYFQALGGGLLKGLGKALSPIFDALGGASGKAEPIQLLVDALSVFGEAMGFVIGIGGMFVSAVAGIFTVVSSALMNGFFAITGSMYSTVADLFSWVGEQIPDGITRGITSRWESLKSKLGDLAGGLATTVRKVLDIRSPSRVFAQIGGNISLGLAEGIEGEGAEARRATMTVVSPRFLMGGSGGGGGGGGRGLTFNATYNFSGTQDTAEVRKAAEEGTLAAAAKLFEAIALESGAVGPAGG